jgi:hypothetical protein
VRPPGFPRPPGFWAASPATTTVGAPAARAAALDPLTTFQITTRRPHRRAAPPDRLLRPRPLRRPRHIHRAATRPPPKRHRPPGRPRRRSTHRRTHRMPGPRSRSTPTHRRRRAHPAGTQHPTLERSDQAVSRACDRKKQEARPASYIRRHVFPSPVHPPTPAAIPRTSHNHRRPCSPQQQRCLARPPSGQTKIADRIRRVTNMDLLFPTVLHVNQVLHANLIT